MTTDKEVPQGSLAANGTAQNDRSQELYRPWLIGGLILLAIVRILFVLPSSARQND